MTMDLKVIMKSLTYLRVYSALRRQNFYPLSYFSVDLFVMYSTFRVFKHVFSYVVYIHGYEI